MKRLNDEIQKPDFSGRGLNPVGGGYALHRIRRLQSFTADNKPAAMIHVDAILDRGNYAAMKNIAGQFVVSELVVC